MNENLLLISAQKVCLRLEAEWLKQVALKANPQKGEPAPPNNYWQAEHQAHQKYLMAQRVLEVIRDAVDRH